MIRVERCPIDEIPDSLNADLDSCSFFNSPGFVRLWDTMGGHGVCWLASEGNDIIAALTGVEFRARPFMRMQSMPDGLYARMYAKSESALLRKEAGDAIVTAVARAGYARLFIADYWNDLAPGRQYETAPCETFLVDVSGADWHPPDSKLQSEIRKAEREGVHIEPFNATAHFDCFMELMNQTEQRHGRNPKYSREFFACLAKLAERDQRVLWTIVMQDGVAAASHINFVSHDLCLNWQIYFDKQFSHLKANQYLLYTTARKVATEGVRVLNLGASPPDAESLRAYKDKWGGTAYRYNMYTCHSWLGRVL